MDTYSVVELLQDLVRINSVNPDTRPGAPGEAECAAFVARWLQGVGCQTEIQEVVPGRPQVLARVPGRNPARRVLMEAHIDTVQADNVVGEPFSGALRNGRVYGRGSVDCKASLAAMMWTLKELAAGEPLEGDVYLLAAMDEEYRYKGVAHLVQTGFVADAAIVGEPTQLSLVVAHNGCLRFEVETRGRSIHTSRASEGSNAIYRMVDLIARLRPIAEDALYSRVHPLVGKAEFCVSLIAGGTGVNTVPDSCRIHIDRRVLPGETAVEAAREFAQWIRQASGGDPDVIVHEPYLIDYSLECPPDAPIVQAMSAAVEAVTSRTPAVVGVPFGTDASKLARAGIPSLVFGPGDIAQAHVADEWVEVDQVRAAVSVLTTALRRFWR